MNYKMRILVLDDSMVARRILVRYLQDIGFKDIVEAVNGDEGLKALERAHANQSPFDVIITDLRMPLVSGIAFLDEIKGKPEYQSIPKLICSVETEHGTLLRAAASGANGYILKPVTVDVLKEKLEKVCAKKVA